MEIGVSLAVGMADHVYRDAVNEDREVGAVVRIETAKQDLVGFAAAMMLADDQSRRQAQNIARRVGRPQFQVPCRPCLFSGGRCRLLTPDVDFDWLGNARLSLRARAN